MKAIAARNEIGVDAGGFAVVRKRDPRLVGRGIVQRDVAHAKQELTAGRLACLHQVLDDFMLGVDGNGLARQLAQVDAMTLPIEGQVEAVMQCAFGTHALAHAAVVEDVHRALFEHAGANGRLDVLPGTTLQDDRFDTLQMKQVGKQQACRAGADNRDLGTHGCLR